MSMEKEKKTLRTMIELYCRKNHNSRELCDDCDELNSYAIEKLEACPHGSEKTACSKCLTHCYKPEMRERIRVVMRFSGPRMILNHPVMAVEHLLKSTD